MSKNLQTKAKKGELFNFNVCVLTYQEGKQ